MDDGLPRRLIDFIQPGKQLVGYQLSPGEWLRPEIIYATASVEPPLIVWATVTYTDPGYGDFGRWDTIPSLVDPPTVASAVGFAFYVTGTASPSSVPRNTTLPPIASPFDSITFSQGLPDTVLSPQQSISIGLSAFDVMSNPVALDIGSASMWAEVVDQSESADVVPPYTAQTFELQLQGTPV